MNEQPKIPTELAAELLDIGITSPSLNMLSADLFTDLPRWARNAESPEVVVAKIRQIIEALQMLPPEFNQFKPEVSNAHVYLNGLLDGMSFLRPELIHVT